MHEPYNAFDICITKYEYDAIFEHDLGADCIANTYDDSHESHVRPHSEVNPEITHVTGCLNPADFDADACACYTD